MDARRLGGYARRVRWSTTAVILVASLGSSTAIADEARRDVRLPLDASPDFVDPSGRSRFHLVTRHMPSTDDALWTFEASGAFRVTKGAAVTFAVPLGWDRPSGSAGRSDQFFIGNVRAGFAGGGRMRVGAWDGVGPPALVYGGGIDLLVPTRPKFAVGANDPACRVNAILCDAAGRIATMRPLAMGSYLAGATGAHAKGQIGFDISRFGVRGELGVLPAIALSDGNDAYLWLTWAARLRAVPLDWLEVFAEIGGTTRLVEGSPPRYPEPPIIVTPGLRFHLGSVSPALFAGFVVSGDAPGDFVFGVDLAGIASRTTRGRADLTRTIDF